MKDQATEIIHMQNIKQISYRHHNTKIYLNYVKRKMSISARQEA